MYYYTDAGLLDFDDQNYENFVSRYTNDVFGVSPDKDIHIIYYLNSYDGMIFVNEKRDDKLMIEITIMYAMCIKDGASDTEKFKIAKDCIELIFEMKKHES